MVIALIPFINGFPTSRNHDFSIHDYPIQVHGYPIIIVHTMVHYGSYRSFLRSAWGMFFFFFLRRGRCTFSGARGIADTFVIIMWITSCISHYPMECYSSTTHLVISPMTHLFSFGKFLKWVGYILISKIWGDGSRPITSYYHLTGITINQPWRRVSS